MNAQNIKSTQKFLLKGRKQLYSTLPKCSLRPINPINPMNSINNSFSNEMMQYSTRMFHSSLRVQQQTQQKDENKSKPNQTKDNQTSAQTESENPFIKFWSVFLHSFKDNFFRQIIIVFSVIAAVYIFYIVSDWFSSITFKNIAQWSFSAGVLSTASIFLTIAAARKYFVLRSSKVYKAALKRVMEDTYVKDVLGSPFTASKFRAYSYYYPDTKQHEMEVKLTRSMQFWKPIHMQMIFKVTGSKKEGTVSCDVSKLPSLRSIFVDEYIFHSLAVDMNDGERIILSGKKENTVYEGKIQLR